MTVLTSPEASQAVEGQAAGQTRASAHPASEHGAGLIALSFAVPFLAMAAYWYCFIQRDYFPSQDDYALIVTSTRMFHASFKGWFLEGFRNYFIGYPGLSLPVTDFVRPVVNGLYYLNSLLFGTGWAFYLLLTYLVQAGLVCLSVKLAVEAAKVPRGLTLAVGCLVFLSPAFGWQQMFLPSFTFDLFASLVVLAAVHELWHRRYVSAWLLMLVGVFTKETTLFAPVAAAILVWIPGAISAGAIPASAARRLRLTAIWLMPVLIWVAVRQVAFHGHGEVYVLKAAGVKSAALGVLHGFLAWPFGTRSLNQGVRIRSVYFLLNGAFWMGCVAALVQWTRVSTHFAKVRYARYSFHVPARSGGQRERLLPGLVLFCSGALAMPLFLNLPQRFGGCFYPLFFLTVATLAHSARSQRMRRCAAACLLAALATSVFQKATDPITLDSARGEWALAGSYIHAIHASEAHTLLLVNDTSGAFTSPALIARFAGFEGTLVRVNNAKILSAGECEGAGVVKVRRDGQGLELTSSLTPPCGFFSFDSVPPEAFELRLDGLEARADAGMSMRIYPPGEEPLPLSATPRMFGVLRVEVHGAEPDFTVLAPDLSGRVYREMR